MQHEELVVVVVDDDPAMARHVGHIVRLTLPNKASVHMAYSGEEALAALDRLRNAKRLMVVSDYNLGAGPTGLDVLARAREHGDARLVLMTGEPRDVYEPHLAEKPVDALLEKPFSLESIQSALRALSG